jgi:hypothetical protein
MMIFTDVSIQVDGVSGADELKSLSQLNITSINLNATSTTDTELQNNISDMVNIKNNPLHAPQRKCPWGIEQVNQMKGVA